MKFVKRPASHPSDGSPVRAIGRNIAWMLASRGLMAVLSLVYLGIVTRALGISGFGRFALITGAASTLATLIAFQSWQVVVRYGVEPMRVGDDERLARLFWGSLLLDVVSAVLGSLIAAVILQLWSDSLGIGSTLKRAALLFAIVDVATIRSTPLGILRLRDRFSLAAVADSITPVTRFVGAFAVLFLHPTVQGFLFVWGIAELLTTAGYWWLAIRTGPLKLLLGRDLGKLIRESPGIVRFALSTNASTTVGMASKQVPLLVVGGTLGVAAAASFRLAAQLAQALTKASQLLSRAAFPEIVKLVQSAPAAALRRMLVRAVLASLLSGCVILAIVAVIGRPALDLVAGQHFAHSYGVLMWMAAAGCIELVTTLLEAIMTARSRAGTALLVRCAGAVTIFVVAWLVVARSGPAGMAVSVFAGSVMATILMGLTAWRSIGVPATVPPEATSLGMPAER